MSNSVIGNLRVNLGIDSAAFSTGLKKTDAGLQKFAAQAAKAGAVIGAAMVGAAAALGKAVLNVADDADKLGKMAQAIGIPVEELSRLKHAADLSGVSMEGLSTSVGRLSKNMADVAAGGGAAAGRAFEQLGISVANADGTLKTSSQVMTEIAGKFATMKDGSEKTAAALALFGRSGMDMIPMLNAGATGMQSMMAEADRLGIVITNRTAKSAEAFNDNLSRLQAGMRGIMTGAITPLLPALENLSTRFVDAANNSGSLHSASGTLTRGLKVVAEQVYRAIVGFERLGVEVGLVLELLQSSDWSNTKRIFNEFIAAGQETQRRLAGIRAEMDEWFSVPNERFDQPAADAGAKWKASLMPLKTEIEEVKTGIGGVKAALVPSSGWTAGLDHAATGMDRLGKTAQDVGATIQQSLSSLFDGIVDGTANAQDAVGGLLKSLTKLALNNAFSALLGSFGGGGISNNGPAIPWSMGSFDPRPAFANGGSFKVGGSGGIDSKLMSFRATPGEMVDIRKPGQENGEGGGPVNITFVDNVGVTATKQSDRMGPNGRDIEIMIEKSARKAVADMSGTNAGRSIGLGRSVRRAG